MSLPFNGQFGSDDDVDVAPPPQKDISEYPLSERFSKMFIEARCTDNILFATAMLFGFIVILSQSLPIILNDWVLLTEPREINRTSENGDIMETTFHYHTGYFQLCRFVVFNFTGTTYTSEELSDEDRRHQCHLNPLITQKDLGDFSVASLAIIVRLGIPALLHISGATICWLALFLGIFGHLNRTKSTLFSSICYIMGSIILSTAVLMVVCVVDDELAPRMKPNAAGEPSQFSYKYGYPFFSAALSFLPVEICACLQAFLFFRRYPSVVEKLRFVPGLEAKLRNAQLDKELGIPPLEPVRRGSLASYLPIPSVAYVERRNSRKGSQASYTSNRVLYVQESYAPKLYND
ncbi:unnamed protein product [Auanema sp. JU1783]|nr:unnamed protein product [Auanema sp. JU1783]